MTRKVPESSSKYGWGYMYDGLYDVRRYWEAKVRCVGTPCPQACTLLLATRCLPGASVPGQRPSQLRLMRPAVLP